VASYDPAKALVLDPVLAYSTYLGGSGDDYGTAIAVDALGNAYVTGDTYGATDFPTTPGAFRTTSPGLTDAFVGKLNRAGSALVYSTYLGGGFGDEGFGIAIEASGNAFVTGLTASSDFPTTPGAFQTTPGGGSCSVPCQDAFVTKLNAAGSALLYSTYLGGSGDDYGMAIAVDSPGNAYVAGATDSTNFPITPGAFQTTFGGAGCGSLYPYKCTDAFVTKLNATGSVMVYSSYLGGNFHDYGSGIAVDSSSDAYVTGETESTNFPTTHAAFQTLYGGGGTFFGDGFISKVNAAGSTLIYSTYLGGGSDDAGFGIALDGSGNACVTGSTDSANFPITPGAFQTTGLGAFVSKLNASGSALLYSTYLGTGAGGRSITLDTLGNAYVTGFTDSPDFPITPSALQKTFAGSLNAFVSELNGSGSALVYSTYLGRGDDIGAGIAVDASRGIYVTGNTFASFPVTPGALQTTFGGTPPGWGDAFVAKIGPADAPGVALGKGTLTFGPQAVGTTSPPQTSTLLGAGSQPLSITSIVASGDFAQTNTCGSAVPSGTSCTIRVTFTPTATGPRKGAVTITDDAAGSPHQLLLSGTGGTSGGGPAVSLKPGTVPFLVPRTVGTRSLPQTVKLYNVGGAELKITGITLTGPNPDDFAQTNNCPSAVAAGASCVITVRFTPTAQGVRTASITITDNAPGSPHMVPLSGRATFLAWAPRSLNMGNQRVGTSSAARTVTLTNAGSAPIALFSIEIVGVNAGDFTQTNTCGSSLKAGASCTIEVTFSPTAMGGRIGHVAIRNNAFGGTHWVGLLGKGT
jgi:hypothetical protein